MSFLNLVTRSSHLPVVRQTPRSSMGSEIYANSIRTVYHPISMQTERFRDGEGSEDVKIINFDLGYILSLDFMVAM